MTTKTCSKCGEMKPLDAYGREKRKRDGRKARCKECNKKQHQQRFAGTVCGADGCANEQCAVGLCKTHYEAQRTAGKVCEFEGCETKQRAAGLCDTHYRKQRNAGTVCEVEGCTNKQCAVGLCRSHYRKQRFAGTVCEANGCANKQYMAGLCVTHYRQQRFAGTVCEADGCADEQRTAGLCNTHYLRLWKHGDPEAFAPDWDEATPTWVYLIQQPEEELVKAGIGFDSRIDRWRRRGWTLLASVQLPRREATALEDMIHDMWWDMGMKPLSAHGDSREGATEMTDATETAVDVATAMMERAALQLAA